MVSTTSCELQGVGTKFPSLQRRRSEIELHIQNILPPHRIVLQIHKTMIEIEIDQETE